MQDRIKTGTLTFHASYNYGSMLQAYALQCALRELGFDNEIVDFRSPAQRRLYRRFTPFNAHGFKHFLKKVYVRLRFGRALDRQYDRFSSFLAERMVKSPVCGSASEVERRVADYDVMICGSDQIWNTRCIDFDLLYLLPFENVGKVAYAPSFGPLSSSGMALDEEDKYREYLPQFDSLSSREDEGAQFIGNLCDRQASVVPDPSILVNRDSWDRLSGEEPLVKGRYLFIYSPRRYSDEFRQVAECIAARHSLKIVVSNYAPGGFLLPHNADCHMDAGPEQFLNLMKNAAFVLCSSFHAVVFSIIFHIPFLAMDGEKDSRIRSILSTYNLNSRTVSLSDVESKCAAALDMDVSDIDSILLCQRKMGLDYLEKSIENAAARKHR